MRRREGGAGCGTRERGKRKPRPRAALGKPPRGTKTAGSVRLAVNAKAVMPRGASRGRGRTRHVRQGPGDPGPPVKNGPVWRNPGHAPSRRVTPLVSRGRKETGPPRARPKSGAAVAWLFGTASAATPNERTSPAIDHVAPPYQEDRHGLRPRPVHRRLPHQPHARSRSGWPRRGTPQSRAPAVEPRLRSPAL